MQKMDGKNYDFKNSSGKSLHCKRWIPTENKPRALVLLVHGFGEHIGSYEEIGNHLKGNGYLAFGHDHLGFGRSEGIRGHIDYFDYYVDDCFIHASILKGEYPKIPTFAMAFSMGGTMVIKCILRNQEFFHGVILMSPAIQLNIPFPMSYNLALYLTKIISIFLPDYTFQLKWLYNFVRMFDNILPCKIENFLDRLTFDLICRNEETRSSFKQDPIVMSTSFTFNLLVEILYAVKDVEAKSKLVNCPLLLLHGSDDKLVSISGSENLFANAQTKDKTFEVVSGEMHALHQDNFETKTEILRKITSWLNSRS